MIKTRLLLEHDGEQVLESVYCAGEAQQRGVALTALAMEACERGLRVGKVRVTEREEDGPVLHEFAVHELMPFWEQGVVTAARLEGGLLDDEE